MTDTVQVKRLPITPEVRAFIFKRDNYTCRYCGNKKAPFHLDHVYPIAKGGETTEENLVTSCLRCNVKKHATVGMWPKPIGYFDTHPKEQNLSHVIFLSLGLALVGNGFWDINMLDVFIGKISLFLGIMFLLILLGRITLGK